MSTINCSTRIEQHSSEHVKIFSIWRDIFLLQSTILNLKHLTYFLSESWSDKKKNRNWSSSSSEGHEVTFHMNNNDWWDIRRCETQWTVHLSSYCSIRIQKQTVVYTVLVLMKVLMVCSGLPAQHKARSIPPLSVLDGVMNCLKDRRVTLLMIYDL